jgi:hypothetical protein
MRLFLNKFGVPYCVIQTVLKTVHFLLAIRSKEHFISFNFYSKISPANVLHDYPQKLANNTSLQKHAASYTLIANQETTI